MIGNAGYLHQRLLLLNLTWSTSLGDARDDNAVTNEALDQPVVITFASDAIGDTLVAEVEITLLADAAVIVLVRDRLATVVAVDAESAGKVAEAWQRRLAEILRAGGSAWRRLEIRLARAERARHADCRLGGSSGVLHGLEWQHLGLVGRDWLRENCIEVGRPRLRLDVLLFDLLKFRGLVIEKVHGGFVERHCGGLKPKLQLRFGGAIELLVDGRVGTIEGDVGAGRVGITLDEQVGPFGNIEENTELLVKSEMNMVRRTRGLSG